MQKLWCMFQGEQSLCARGSYSGIIYYSETQKLLIMKNVCVNKQMNNFWLGIIHSQTTHKWKRWIYPLFSSVLSLPNINCYPCNFPIIFAIIFYLSMAVLLHESRSVSFSRNLAWVKITCGNVAGERSDPPLISRQGPFIFKLLIKGRVHHRQQPPTFLTNLTVKLDPSHLAWFCLWCSSRA